MVAMEPCNLLHQYGQHKHRQRINQLMSLYSVGKWRFETKQTMKETSYSDDRNDGGFFLTGSWQSFRLMRPTRFDCVFADGQHRLWCWRLGGGQQGHLSNGRIWVSFAIRISWLFFTMSTWVNTKLDGQRYCISFHNAYIVGNGFQSAILITWRGL